MTKKDNLDYLFSPCNSIVKPPISGNCHELPFKEVTWENFEKLCLKIVELDHSLDSCEIIGRKGDKQEGIDIYAIKTNGRYDVYQCKRYQKLSKSDLEEVVKDFRKGNYAGKTDNFILFTSAELNKPVLQSKFNELKKELKKEGVEFIKRDPIQLNRLLKDHPIIVYDFFGRGWTKEYNGKEILESLEERRKLDNSEIICLRKELHSLYTTVFHNYDPGIPSHGFSDDPHFLLRDRFIIPDFDYQYLNTVSETLVDSEGEKNQSNENRSIDTLNNPFSIVTKRGGNSKRHVERKFKRNNVDNELSRYKKSIVLGDPGAGKSALLRFVTLDILSYKPRLSNTFREWGELLPIWLPFAFLTKKINERDNLNLSGIIELWLESNGKKDLFKLVEKALEDERLLLIIDGIDEWTNKSEANLAISKIEIQAEHLNTHVLYSSRPYGYKFLKDEFQNVKELWISSFSESQQENYVNNWYKKWAESVGEVSDSYSKLKTDSFMSEIEKSNDYKSLSKNPLLLSILISQKFRDSVLPKNKFKALEAITDQLIEKRPNQRDKSAGITRKDNYEFDLSDVFSELAFHVQSKSHEGIIIKSEAIEIIQNFLISMMDFEKGKAKKVSKELLNVGANNIGIIIEKSSEEIAFAHRQFQEFLASKYIFEDEQNATEETLRTYGGDQSWNEVITYFFNRIHPKKTDDFTKYLSLIEPTQNNDYKSNQYVKFLRYKLILTLNNSPIKLSKTTLLQVHDEFVFESRLDIKRILWNILLDSFQNGKIRDEVLKIYPTFMPNEIPFSDNRISTLKILSPNELSENLMGFLFQNIINGNAHQRLEASQVINKFISLPFFFDRITSTIEKSHNPVIVGYCINAIISDEVDIKIKERVYNRFKSTIHEAIAFFNYKLKVHLDKHTSNDLNRIIEIQDEVHYTLNEEILNLLIKGWSGEKKLKDYCLHTINSDGPSGIHDKEIAWTILIRCYNEDEDIIERVCEEIKTREYPFSGIDKLEGWGEILEYFQGNKKVSDAIDEWVPNQDFREPEVSFACLVGKSNICKNFLIDKLPLSGVSHWYCMSLVEGWGNDPEVLEFLQSYFRNSENKKRQMAAQYVSKIFSDEKEDGIKILEEILFDRELNFRDRAIRPIIELDRNYFKEHILVKFVENELDHLDKHVFGQYYTAIFLIVDNFKGETVVDNFIKEKCHSDNWCRNTLHSYYPNLFDIEENFKFDRPLHHRFRYLAIERFKDQLDVRNELSQLYSKFQKETDENVSMKMAVSYFNYLVLKDKKEVIRISEENLDYRGHDYENVRRISFSGFLIAEDLDGYMELSKESNHISPNFSRYLRRGVDSSIARILVNNFDKIREAFGLEFESFFSPSTDEEDKWCFWAQISDNSSQAHPYIMNYISNNYDTIEDSALIDYLNRFSPRSVYLKRIAVRLLNSNHNSLRIQAGRILGENFSEDQEVLELISTIGKHEYNPGKIMALSISRPDSKVLKECFDELVKHRPHMESSVAFRLKCLFRDAEHIYNFLMEIIKNHSDAKRYHKYYYIPLIKRLNRDEELVIKLNEEFVKSRSISVQISFYRLLEHVNKVSPNSREKFRRLQKNESNAKIGYNITSNKLESMFLAFNPVSF